MSHAAAFSWRSTKDGRVLIDWEGRTVTTLAGRPASRFLDAVAQAPEEEQLLLARATGNFKRGNER